MAKKTTQFFRSILVLVAGLSTFSAVAAETPAPAKSPVRAFVMSLAVPGAGEYYLGHRTAAAFFLSTEACLWLGAAGFSTYSSWRTEDAKAYAAQTAGVDLDAAGSNEDYFRALGDYQDLEEYNHTQRITGNPGLVFSADMAWQWPGDRERERYLGIRRSAKLAASRISYIFGAVAFNHLASALNTVRLVKARQRTERLKTSVGCVYEAERERVMLSWWRRF